MACSCASGAADCMARPGVATLDCGTDCCDPDVLTLGDIDPEIVAWYDAGQVDPPQGTDAERALLDKHAAAIEVAFAKIAGSVCLGRYVSDCVLVAEFCVDSRCSCSCRSCSVCFEESQSLAELSEFMAPDRILSATVDGDTISVNGSEPDAAIELATNVGWRLFGVGEGTHEIQIQTRAPKTEFVEAVKSLACFRIPGPHAKDCDSDEATARVSRAAQLRQFDLIGDKFADDLHSDCDQAGARLGRSSAVRWVRWTGGDPTEPAVYLSVGEHFDFADTADFSDGDFPQWNDAAQEFQPAPSSGAGDKFEQYDFVVPADVWTAIHTIGRPPTVTAVDENGRQIEGTLDYTSATRVDYSFDAAIIGSLYLS